MSHAYRAIAPLDVVNVLVAEIYFFEPRSASV